jgi:hypothetical protein
MKRYLQLILISLLLNSCATILSHNTYLVGINSHPQHAKLRITDNTETIIFDGNTPVALFLKSYSGPFTPAVYHIYISKDSFQTKSYIVQSKFNRWSFGNIIFPFGFIIDGLTGNLYQIRMTYFQDDLVPKNKIIKYDDLPTEIKK